jgi:hypothetical protein
MGVKGVINRRKPTFKVLISVRHGEELDAELSAQRFSGRVHDMVEYPHEKLYTFSFPTMKDRQKFKELVYAEKEKVCKGDRVPGSGNEIPSL